MNHKKTELGNKDIATVALKAYDAPMHVSTLAKVMGKAGAFKGKTAKASASALMSTNKDMYEQTGRGTYKVKKGVKASSSATRNPAHKAKLNSVKVAAMKERIRDLKGQLAATNNKAAR